MPDRTVAKLERSTPSPRSAIATRHAVRRMRSARTGLGHDPQHDEPHGAGSASLADSPRPAAAPGWMCGHVLVIEQEAGPERGEIGATLRAEGLGVAETDDGREGLQEAAAGGFDLVMFDLEARGFGGLHGCRRLRLQSDASLVIVSAHDSEADRVRGFDAGADGFLGAPFATAELVSRVRALLRRRQLDRRPPDPLLRAGDLEVDRVSRTVLIGGAPVSLTPTEFRLLALLAEEPGRVHAPAEILRVLWQSDHVPHTGACKVHISNLRQKLERDPSRPERIVTVRGVGYRLVAH